MCILGPSGVGKTWLVHSLFPRCAELTADILRSKQDTLSFLNKMQGTDIPVILDEYESLCDLVGLREITTVPSRGQFIIISQIPIKFEFDVITWNFPILNQNEILKIFPDADPVTVDRCKGNLHMVVHIKSDYRDVCTSTKDFIESIACIGSTLNPLSILGESILEPGNSSAILNENYTGVKGADVEYMARITEHFSHSGVFEAVMYDGDWSLMSYYNLFAVILPVMEINHRLSLKFRPGSTWTKHQNACMRLKRVQGTMRRSGLVIDSLIFLRHHIDLVGEGAVPLLRHYGLAPADIDIMNHLSPLRKIPAKMVASLKKSLTPPRPPPP